MSRKNKAISTNLERGESYVSELQASQHSTSESNEKHHTEVTAGQTNATATTRAFRRDERALDDDDDRGELPRAAGITASFSGTTRALSLFFLLLFFCRFRGPPILGLAHVKVKPRKCTTKFPPSSSIAALLTSTLPSPSAHWYPYCKQRSRSVYCWCSDPTRPPPQHFSGEVWNGNCRKLVRLTRA